MERERASENKRRRGRRVGAATSGCSTGLVWIRNPRWDPSLYFLSGGLGLCVCAHARRWEGRMTDKSKSERDGRRRRGGVQLLPAVPYPFVVCAPQWGPDVLEKKFPAAYFFFLLRKWDCSCLRPVDDPIRTRCSGDASQWGQTQMALPVWFRNSLSWSCFNNSELRIHDLTRILIQPNWSRWILWTQQHLCGTEFDCWLISVCYNIIKYAYELFL